MGENMTDTMLLNGKVIAVTGASSGIGRAIAENVAKAGAKVACCGRNREKLETVMGSLSGDGHGIFLFDSGDLPGTEATTAEIAKAMGPMSGMVHSAGVSSMQLLRDTDYEASMKLFQVNFMVFLALAKGACRRGRYAPGMSVVGISSIAGVSPDAGLSVYSASKAALNASIKALSKEYAPRCIRFNAICPSFVNTPMTDGFRAFLGEGAFKEKIEKNMPLGMIETDDIANAARFFLSDDSRRITGALLEITGGGGAFVSM
jgi:NAD(P)-dependent dehydrogenase (short-subunit alcohol dehydrogenase family)